MRKPEEETEGDRGTEKQVFLLRTGSKVVTGCLGAGVGGSDKTALHFC